MAQDEDDYRVSHERYESLAGDPWEVVGAAFDHVWGEDVSDDERVRRFAQLTRGQRVIVPLSSLHAESINGGLCQYFYNVGSMFCHEAFDGLVTLGARHSEILARALGGFPNGRVPRRREDRLLALYAGDRERLKRELDAALRARAHPTTPRNVDWADVRIERLLEHLTHEYFKLEEKRRTSVEQRLAARYVRKNLREFVRVE